MLCGPRRPARSARYGSGCRSAEHADRRRHQLPATRGCAPLAKVGRVGWRTAPCRPAGQSAPRPQASPRTPWSRRRPRPWRPRRCTRRCRCRRSSCRSARPVRTGTHQLVGQLTFSGSQTMSQSPWQPNDRGPASAVGAPLTPPRLRGLPACRSSSAPACTPAPRCRRRRRLRESFLPFLLGMPSEPAVQPSASSSALAA